MRQPLAATSAAAARIVDFHGRGGARAIHATIEIGDDRLADDRIGGVGIVDQHANIVLRRQRHRDDVAIGFDLALADQVERGLEVVGEGGDAVEAEHRAGALDGVQRSKRGIDQIAVLRRLAEVEERRFEAFEKFGDFLPEGFCGVYLVHLRTNFAITESNWSGLKGLVSHPVAPAALASRFTASSDSVVRNTIGTPA